MAPIGPNSPIVLDASAALVLFASGRIEEILAAWSAQAYVVQETIDEVRYLRDPKEETEWRPLLANSAIKIMDRVDSSEFAEFVRLAQLMDEGEAAAGAAAGHRGYDLVIDDLKARRIVGVNISLHWSLDLVHRWCQNTASTEPEIGEILRQIRRRARYAPHGTHPRLSWWEHCFPLE